VIPDHELIRRIGDGAYGEVWLARNVLGGYRAVKVVFRGSFKTDEPYAREFRGIQRFEPISRTSEGWVDILQVGRNEAEGYFYYVMELADDEERQKAGGGRQKETDGQSPAPGSALCLLPSDLAQYIPRTLAGEIRRRGRLPPRSVSSWA